MNQSLELREIWQENTSETKQVAYYNNRGKFKQSGMWLENVKQYIPKNPSVKIFLDQC